jgi:hypothetical protein
MCLYLFGRERSYGIKGAHNLDFEDRVGFKLDIHTDLSFALNFDL